MVKNTIETLRRGVQKGLALAMLALVTMSHVAQADEEVIVTVSPSVHRARLGDAARPISIRWKLEGLGLASAKSTSGSFLTSSGARLGAPVTRLLFEDDFYGAVAFAETLTVPAGIVAEAHRRGLDRLKFVRTFSYTVYSEPMGSATSSATGELTVLLETSRTTVDDPATVTVADACASRSTVLGWEITAEGTGPLDIESSQGVFFAGGDRLAVVDQPLSRGKARGRAILRENLTLGPELAAAAQSRGVSSLRYVRSFTFRGAGGFAVSDEAQAVFEVEAPRFEVSVSPAREALPVERAVSVPLTWSAIGEPCPQLTLASRQGWFQTPAGARLGQPVLRPLSLGGTIPAMEVLAIPVEVTSRALQLGSGRIEFVREFRDSRFEANQDPVEGRLILDLSGRASAAFAVHRLALRFRGGEPFQLVTQHGRLQAVADIVYTGSGLLQATWEVADPGSTLGQPVFRPLRLVRTRLTAGGEVELVSPELPTGLIGGYRLRLRITDPNLATAGGQASGFEVPIVAYQVGAGRGVERPKLGTSVDIETGLPTLPEHIQPVDESGSYEEREVVVMIGAGDRSMDEALAEAAKLKGLGYTPKQRMPLDALGLVVSVLRVPREKTVPEVVDELRDHGQWADANHIFLPQTVSADCGCVGAEQAGQAIGWRPTTNRSDADHIRIGLIDTPVDPDRVCVADRKPFLLRPRASEHGTRVAGLLVGDRRPGASCQEQTVGLAPNAELYVAEAVDPLRGTTLVRLFRALDWLVDDKDIALVLLNAAGPDNLLLGMLLELTIGALPEEIVMVAPYGREASRGGQLYPADYTSVFGVVAVSEGASCHGRPDASSRVLAAPGPGIDLSTGRESGACCSNSCAAPFVTAALSLAMDGAGPGLSRPVLRQRLRQSSQDLDGISLLVKAPVGGTEHALASTAPPRER